MNSAVLLVLALMLLAHAAAEESVHLSINCPNVCDSDVGAVLRECASLYNLGCSLRQCSKGLYSCSKEKKENDLEGGHMPARATTRMEDSFSFNIELTAQPLPLDVYFLFDGTFGSVWAYESLSSGFSDLVKFFKQSELFQDPHFGVGAFGDETDADFDEGFENLQSITGNSDLANNAINEYLPRPGFDFPEANLVGLFRVATDDGIRWRENSRKIIIYNGDAPGYEPTCGRDGVITRERVINALLEKNIIVIGLGDSFSRPGEGFFGPGVSSRTCGRITADIPGQTRQIVDATGGVLFAADSFELPESIQDAIEILPAKIWGTSFSLETEGCDEAFTLASDPSFPITLEVGESQSVSQTVSLIPDFCGGDGPSFLGNCQLTFTTRPYRLPPQSFSTNASANCSI